MEHKNAMPFKEGKLYFYIDGKAQEVANLNIAKAPDLEFSHGYIEFKRKSRIQILCKKITRKIIKFKDFFQKIGKK